MAGADRYFLMFASMYGCIIAYWILNGYSFGPQPLVAPHTKNSVAPTPVLLASAIALRGATPPSNFAADTDAAQSAAPNLKPTERPHVEESNSGITDLVNNVVKCKTTHGDLIIDVRPTWAPEGSKRFVQLVDSGHFTHLPFFRVCPKYLTQFGHRYFDSESFDPTDLDTLKDDPSIRGIRDMDFGYFFFTGNTDNDRKSEMAISFCEMENCDVTGLGHKAWEVPVATVRHGYFETLLKIMETGKPYPRLEVGSLNGQGPDLEKLQNDRDYLKKTFPDMAYFESCRVAQRNTRVTRPVAVDHPMSIQKPLSKGKLISTSASSSGNSAVAAAENKAIAPVEDDDGNQETKSLEEYLLGGESRKQRLDGKDAMSIVTKSMQEVLKAQETPTPTQKPKSPVAPSGLRGENPFNVRFQLRLGSGDVLGDIVVQIRPEWAPLGAKRFQDLVAAQFFDNARFFRSIKGFVTQFGIPAVPLSKAHPWARLPIPDDEVVTTNARGTLSFASSGKNSRSNQLFFNAADNGYLDKQGFAPLGVITEGLELLDKIYTGYGDKPNQGQGNRLGNEYFVKEFPKLTYMETVRLM